VLERVGNSSRPAPITVDNEPVVDVAHLEQPAVEPQDRTLDTTFRIWLGEPVESGSPVEVPLPREDGANLLVVTDDEQIGQGILAGAISTAASTFGSQVEIRVLDFMPLEAGFGEAALALSELSEVVVGRRRNFVRMLEQVHALVRARAADANTPRSPCLFVVNGLEHARELEVGASSAAVDHDLGLSRQLEEIVREGPLVGIHTLVWAMHHTTLDQRLTRDVASAFGLRVVGKTDESTSEAIIESTVAASLPPWQVLLYDEFRSRLVRFRPYTMPKATWTDADTALTSTVGPTELT
jgi:hypothetical protein